MKHFLILLSLLVSRADAKELYSGEGIALRDYLWGSYYMAENGCETNTLTEEKQNSLCQDPSLMLQVESENNQRKRECEEVGGSYAFSTAERREASTRRNIIPIVCKISCVKVSHYTCTAVVAEKEELASPPDLEGSLASKTPTPEPTPANETPNLPSVSEKEEPSLPQNPIALAADLELTVQSMEGVGRIATKELSAPIPTEDSK